MPANSRWDLIRRLRVKKRVFDFVKVLLKFQFILYLIFVCLFIESADIELVQGVGLRPLAC